MVTVLLRDLINIPARWSVGTCFVYMWTWRFLRLVYVCMFVCVWERGVHLKAMEILDKLRARTSVVEFPPLGGKRNKSKRSNDHIWIKYWYFWICLLFTHTFLAFTAQTNSSSVNAFTFKQYVVYHGGFDQRTFGASVSSLLFKRFQLNTKEQGVPVVSIGEGSVCGSNVIKTSACPTVGNVSILFPFSHLPLFVLCVASPYTCIHSFTHLTRTTLIERGGEAADSISGDKIGFDGGV